ncbi:unnamed protein product [Pylaiella littoralis]
MLCQLVAWWSIQMINNSVLNKPQRCSRAVNSPCLLNQKPEGRFEEWPWSGCVVLFLHSFLLSNPWATDFHDLGTRELFQRAAGCQGPIVEPWEDGVPGTDAGRAGFALLVTQSWCSLDSPSCRSKSTPWMGQSFNPQAVSSITRVIRHPALAVPHLSLTHIGQLDFEGLKAMGCKGIIFDKDNTLTAPYDDTAHPLVEEGLRRCMEIFEGRVCIMSNSAGTRDDPDYIDAIRIEMALGIPVLRHDEKKPGGIAEVLDFFEGKNTEGRPVRLDELCFIGDRLLTDVVFGNMHGMLTVHTQPLTLEGDNKPAAVFRFLEKRVFMNFFHQRCSVEPLAHHLCPEGAGVLERGGSEGSSRRETTPVLNET